MDVLEDIAPVIAHDVQQCLIGLDQGDSHLLVVQKPRIDHYINILSTFVTRTEEDHARVMASQCIENLQAVRIAIDSCLESVNGRNKANVYLPLTVESVIRRKQRGMPWSKIAALHGVSRQTLYKFRVKNNIEDPNREVNDEELQELIVDVNSTMPRAGAVYIKGALTAMGVKVAINRLKQHLREVNPEGVLLRRRETIYRREFTVPGANYLWCMDSNHKLIMFRMVLHGCIDAFSRKLIYLKIATNNLADTVLTMFEEGVNANGLPRRVRGDKGVENVRVKEYMEANRPDCSHPFIQGRSVHNTRIERLWRETNIHVSFQYKVLFAYLEEEELLDEHSEIDLLCLAYVYIPRIQKDLDAFVQTWNNHPMYGKFMNGRTPLSEWEDDMDQQSIFQFSNSFSSLNGYTDNNVDNQSNNYDHDNYDVDCYSDHDTYYDDDVNGEDVNDSNHAYCHTSYNNNNDDVDHDVVVPEYSAETLINLLSEVLPDPLVEDGHHGVVIYSNIRNILYEFVSNPHAYAIG